jgi:hypothetical protein
MGDVDMQVDEFEQNDVLETSPFKEELQKAIEVYQGFEFIVLFPSS